MDGIFRRVEKKYIINKKEYEIIMKKIREYVVQDEYGKSTICNIYMDTDNYDLISHSITKPFFKDKVRLRSYNTPTKNSTVYLEIKRKVDGVVGKRRIAMKLNDFDNYIDKNDVIRADNNQIISELEYYFNMYNLSKKMYISYEREAYYQKDNSDFRVTFDSNVKARTYSLNLDKGAYGQNILAPDKYIMEVKTLGAMPLWFVKILNECKIMPCGFSKYGEAYTQLVLHANNYEKCVV